MFTLMLLWNIGINVIHKLETLISVHFVSLLGLLINTRMALNDVGYYIITIISIITLRAPHYATSEKSGLFLTQS